jgi:hypothetical protein
MIGDGRSTEVNHIWPIAEYNGRLDELNTATTIKNAYLFREVLVRSMGQGSAIRQAHGLNA